jgi:hypothetical protein
MIYVTAEQLVTLTGQVESVLAPYRDKTARAAGSRPVAVVQLAIPAPEDGAP